MIKIVKWIVVLGKQLWRKIWFPTANLNYKSNILEDWTYKINIIVKWKIYWWAWVYRKNINLLEWHIFDFNQIIYWEKIEIILLEKIRENKKINSLKELKKLIQNDVKIIKNIAKNIATFWSFDLIHEWHKYYLNQSRKYWDNLITIIATDKNIEKFKNKKPKYNINLRIKHIKKLNIKNHIVIKWDEIDPLKFLEKYDINIVCLWYDQIWFYENLKKHIKQNNLNIRIYRLWDFKKNIYKSSILK